jgi:hypothetical protein
MLHHFRRPSRASVQAGRGVDVARGTVAPRVRPSASLRSSDGSGRTPAVSTAPGIGTTRTGSGGSADLTSCLSWNLETKALEGLIYPPADHHCLIHRRAVAGHLNPYTSTMLGSRGTPAKQTSTRPPFRQTRRWSRTPMTHRALVASANYTQAVNAVEPARSPGHRWITTGSTTRFATPSRPGS